MPWKALYSLGKGVKRNFSTSCKWTGSHHKPNQTDNQDGKCANENELALPPEPIYCCMSGCANCVWIRYAQELAQMFGNGDELARQKILEKVHDPNHRAFLFTQLGLNETDGGK